MGSTPVVLNCLCSHKRPESLAGTCAWPVTWAAVLRLSELLLRPTASEAPRWATHGHLFPGHGAAVCSTAAHSAGSAGSPGMAGLGSSFHRTLCSTRHGGSGRDLGATVWPSWHLLESWWELDRPFSPARETRRPKTPGSLWRVSSNWFLWYPHTRLSDAPLPG